VAGIIVAGIILEEGAKRKGQEEIFHFPFSICHFLFGEEVRVSRGSAVEIENEK
jgi:hypothetical protein